MWLLCWGDGSGGGGRGGVGGGGRGGAVEVVSGRSDAAVSGSFTAGTVDGALTGAVVLRSGGATWSKLRWTEVGLRNQKKNRPLTHFLFQARPRVNPHQWDDVGKSHLLEQRAF